MFIAEFVKIVAHFQKLHHEQLCDVTKLDKNSHSSNANLHSSNANFDFENSSNTNVC